MINQHQVNVELYREHIGAVTPALNAEIICHWLQLFNTIRLQVGRASSHHTPCCRSLRILAAWLDSHFPYCVPHNSSFSSLLFLVLTLFCCAQLCHKEMLEGLAQPNVLKPRTQPQVSFIHYQRKQHARLTRRQSHCCRQIVLYSEHRQINEWNLNWQLFVGI